MSFYRVLYYPLRKDRFKHMYFPRRRGGGSAEENTKGILEKLDKLDADSKNDENLRRAQRTIRDLVLCNKFEYFCTFTFNAHKVNRYDFDACKKKITEVFKNYKNRYSPDFRYIVVPEFHKDGGVHFHGLVRGIRKDDLTVPDYIWKRSKRTGELLLVPNTKKYIDWTYYSKKLGFFSCSRIKNYEKCARYVAKYVTKDLINLPLGQRVFMASTGLTRPELVFDEDDIPKLFDNADFANKYVEIKESPDSFGALPEWWGELCAELRDDIGADEGDDGGPLIEKEIFERLTGSQLVMYG